MKKPLFRKMPSLLSKCLLSCLVFMLATSPSASALTSTQSIAIPAYEYPTLTNLWPEIDTAGGSNVPFVIVNPASGPGVSANSDYTTRIATNTSEGIRSIGYVDTNYQSRSITDVIADIDQWYTLYPGISGIFFDRVSVVDSAALCYSAYIYNYTKVAHPDDLVIHNFGTYTSPDYEPYGDIFVTAEMDYTLYQTWMAPSDGFQNVASNSNRFWHLIHTTPLADYPDALSDSQNNNAGWVYITDDILPNPYDEAASYFSTEVNDVALLPASTIPNRGVTELPTGCLDVTADISSTVSAGTTASTLSLTNTSSLYEAPSPNQFSFSLPTGVTLASTSSTGDVWSCSDTTCTYADPIAASGTSPALNANFTADCSYTSGNITVTSTTFPSHEESNTIAVQAPNNCPSETTPSTTSPEESERLADTGANSIFTLLSGVVFISIATAVLFWATNKKKRQI